jgi:ubiquinone/menaquinone biosynthesis C-methylase UbiE
MNTNFLGERIRDCLGIDIDANAVKHARSYANNGTHFISGDAMCLPFRDEYFDIVICNHVYEHVPDSFLLMDEIYRVLKTGGFCYFAAGNKYRLIEGHYHLPFLSWLPRPLSNLYLRITKKGNVYYEKHLSYFQLQRLVKKFLITDYTLRILKEPERFGAEDMIGPDSIIRSMPKSVFQALKFFIPVYIFILTKT